jgi:hypothetical protein
VIVWLTIEGYLYPLGQTKIVGTFLAGRSVVCEKFPAATYNIYPEEILRIWLR